MSTKTSMFKTPAGQTRYFAAYDATLALWAVPVEALQVPTRFGETHINVCGAVDAPPLVLLPGAAISSTMWYPNVAALSSIYRIYALDIIGDMGKSVSTYPATKPVQFVQWLNDVFDALQLEQTYVTGISLGGFLALKLAQLAPERVRKLVLLSPASLLRLRPQFYARVAAAILVPFLSREKRQALFLGTASPNAVPAITQLMTPTDFRYRMFFPKAETDRELQQVQAETLLLLGEHEVIYNPQIALNRAVALIPNIEARIIPGAGHAVNIDQPELVTESIIGFLK